VIERRIPNIDQVAALTQSMPEQYRAAVTLAAWGTLRRGEVLGLNRQDIDLRAGFDLDPLINEEECSGGETRTHNLAVNSRLLCH